MLKVCCELGEKADPSEDTARGNTADQTSSLLSFSAFHDTGEREEAAENSLDPRISRKLLALFRENKKDLLARALLITGSIETAEDVLQDSYLKLHRMYAQSDEDPVDHHYSYLFRIVENTAIDLLRRRARRPALSIEELPEAVQEKVNDIPIDKKQEPLNTLLSSDNHQQLWRAIGRLPERYRKTVITYLSERQENGKFNAVAEKLGLSSSTVRVQYARARNMLRKLMEEH